MIIGIDFGTCFSSAAVMTGMIPVTTYIRDTTGFGIPSAFMYDSKAGVEKFGEECETSDAWMHSDDIIRHVKRTIREGKQNVSSEVMSGGMKFTYKHIIESYLTYLINMVKEGAINSGEVGNPDIEAVAVTVPVGIDGKKMMASEYNQIIVDTVMRITGLPKNKIFTLQEPVGAAISYLYSEGVRSHHTEPQTVLVFDLGGGTLDVTTVVHDPASMKYRIKAKEGDLELGGYDWDNALAEEIMRRTGVREFASVEEKAKFEKEITKLKVALTNVDESGVFFKYNGRSMMATITRKEFDDITSDLRDRALGLTIKTLIQTEMAFEGQQVSDDSYEKLMRTIHGKTEDTTERDLGRLTEALGKIDKFVLVGGSCNMPQIREGMIEKLHLSPDKVIVHDPSKAIAKGAALYAKMNYLRENEYDPDEDDTDVSLITPGEVVDIASHTYGIGTNITEEHIPVIENFIFRGTEFEDDTITVASDSPFSPLRDSQNKVGFYVYESDANREDCTRNMMPISEGIENGLGIEVDVPRKYRGIATEYSVWVQLSLDKNGVLEITARDKDGTQVGCARSSE